MSDGGLFQDHGYYGWVIANDASIIWEGRGRVPGNHDQFDSLRSESSGFLHALKVAYETLTAHDHAVTSATLGSDSKVLIDRVQQFQISQGRPPKMYVLPHMDIQCQIDRVLGKLNESISQINVVHVKGHQDTKKASRLSWLERLNVRADQLATLERYHLELKTFRSFHACFPAAKIQLYLANNLIHKYVPSEIHNAIMSDKYLSYLTYKFKWKNSTYKYTDW